MGTKKKTQSVFHDLCEDDRTAEMEMRSALLIGLEQWLATSAMTQREAGKVLGLTQARVSDIKRGNIAQFSLDVLVQLTSRAGLRTLQRLSSPDARSCRDAAATPCTDGRGRHPR
jgi:predicted XRE-type DNA-binding protein